MLENSSSGRFDVVIVGGGFSAACLTIQLLVNRIRNLSLAIVHRDASVGRGVAYRTDCDAHILNVPVARMSILPDKPGHFLDWASTRYQFEGNQFVPRRIYGEYIEECLAKVIAATPGVTIERIHDVATSLVPDSEGVSVTLGTSQSIYGRLAVLAIGNSPPVSPPCFASLSPNRYKQNAWASETALKIGSTDSVLVVGTGLTAIDQILALSRDDHAGTIYVLSRRGKLPALHAPAAAWPSDWTKGLPADIRSIFRHVRKQIEVAVAAGADWRSVIDSLRHATPGIWQSLSPEQKQRFIRHARPYWEIARHRIPASTHKELERLMSERRMILLSGRIGVATEFENYVEVSYTDRETSTTKMLRVDRVINCTGPGTVSRVKDQLLAGLLDQGLARLDCLGLGIETGSHGAVIDAGGVASERIFAIGPVRKASLWESTAVPEIRVQAKELAEMIGARLGYSEAAESA
jgi:uncharacterized NAD(P)/FAD-binding protein YdhS